MILSTLNQIPGKKVVEHYGMVSGSTVQSRSIFFDIAAFGRNLLGGEIEVYSELMEITREEATRRMIKQAEEQGANAILAVRFSTSEVASRAAEIYIYGTAVKVE
jgi:uncharacterized protein YbjQ (UPF0145 family)